jgi:hypothetical protein
MNAGMENGPKPMRAADMEKKVEVGRDNAEAKT